MTIHPTLLTLDFKLVQPRWLFNVQKLACLSRYDKHICIVYDAYAVCVYAYACDFLG